MVRRSGGPLTTGWAFGRLGRNLWMVAILLVSSLIGCQPEAHVGSVQVDRSSPHEVLSGFDRASSRREYQTMLACLVPEQRGPHRRYYGISEQYHRKLQELVQVVEAKLGQAQADLIRRRLGRYPEVGFADVPRVGEQIDWQRIEIVAAGPQAEARIPGGRGLVFATLVQRDGQWLLREYTGPVTEESSLDSLEAMIDCLCDQVDTAISDVESGRVTRSSFASFLEDRFGDLPE